MRLLRVFAAADGACRRAHARRDVRHHTHDRHAVRELRFIIRRGLARRDGHDELVRRHDRRDFRQHIRQHLRLDRQYDHIRRLRDLPRRRARAQRHLRLQRLHLGSAGIVADQRVFREHARLCHAAQNGGRHIAQPDKSVGHSTLLSEFARCRKSHISCLSAPADRAGRARGASAWRCRSPRRARTRRRR